MVGRFGGRDLRFPDDEIGAEKVIEGGVGVGAASRMGDALKKGRAFPDTPAAVSVLRVFSWVNSAWSRFVLKSPPTRKLFTSGIEGAITARM
jgi:hypothetical protein